MGKNSFNAPLTSHLATFANFIHKMPRVLRILNRLAIGGPLLNATYLTKYMAPEFETLLVVGEKEDHEESATYLTDKLGITPLYLPQMGRAIDIKKDREALKKLKEIIGDFKPHILHTHAAKPGALGRLAAYKMKVPVIVHTYHGHVFHSYFGKWKTRFYLEIERYLARKSDTLIAISPAQRHELAHTYKIAEEDKFRIVQLGLDLDTFADRQQEKRKAFRKAYGLSDDVVAIGIVGRLVPVKNHSLFLESLAYVLKNSKIAIKAFIIGDGETRKALEQQALQLGIPFSTHTDLQHMHPLVFTSWRTDIDVINAGLDIAALSSLNEGTPVSLIEAQAAGVPIVSTRVGGIEDIVLPGKTALLSPIENTELYCKNMLQMVEDAHLRKQMKENGPAFVMQQFSYQRLVRDMTLLYNDLLTRKHVIF